MRYFKFIFSVAFAAIFAACSDTDEQPAVAPAEVFPTYTAEYKAPEVEKFRFSDKEFAIYNNINRAGIDMFKTICADNPADKNILASPFGASVVLSMLANNMNVDAHEAILKTFGADNIDELNMVFKRLMRDTPFMAYNEAGNEAAADYHIDNALWFEQGKMLDTRFSRLLPDFYNAEFFPADFIMSQGVVNDINAWTADKTEGMIPHFIDNLDENTIAVLVNTLYYSACWERKFGDTYSSVFHGVDGDSRVEMMKGTVYDDGRYAENDDAVLVTKNMYPFTFTIIMPKEGTSIDNLLADGDIYALLTAEGDPDTRVNLEMPKFEFANADFVDFGAAIAAMGVKSLSCKIFDDDTLWPLTIRQKSKITVDEEHVAGASATAAMFTGGFSPRPNVVDVKVDRPFLFFVRTILSRGNGLSDDGEIVQAGKIVKL